LFMMTSPTVSYHQVLLTSCLYLSQKKDHKVSVSDAHGGDHVVDTEKSHKNKSYKV
jgi:hypothetical protein